MSYHRGTSSDDLGELLDSIDPESYLDREGIRYKVTHGSSGTQLNLRECPECGGSQYKVYLNADSGLGNCFHGDCEAKFGKWSFIKAHLGTESSREVFDHIKAVAREMGWRAKKTTSAAVNLDKPELVLPDSIALPHDGRNLKYLSDRSIDVDTVGYFHLRYSQSGQFWYKTEDGEVRHQDYSKRLIIPIFDMEGNMVSFQGRDVTNMKGKKYLFPPGFASTGKHIYNGHNVIGVKRIVVNEGVFDVFATKIALDDDMDLRDVGVVGTFGKHLSHGSFEESDQLNKFIVLKESGLKEVTIMWDGEGKALLDAIKTGILLKGLGLVVRIAVLPKDKDPNEVTPGEVVNAFWSAVTVNRNNMIKLKMMASRRMH
jgi:DNA primase